MFSMPFLLLLGFVLLFLLWMFCTLMDEWELPEAPSVPMTSKKEEAQQCPETPFTEKKSRIFNQRSSSSRLRRYIKPSYKKSFNEDKSSDEHPHDHQEYPHEMPDALRPRRMVMGRPPEEENEEEEPFLKNHDRPTSPFAENKALEEKTISSSRSTRHRETQTEAEENPLLISRETHRNVETEEETTQTDSPSLRASVSVQAGVEQEEKGVQTKEPVVRSSASSKSQSFESSLLKPKHLSSSSEEESERLSSVSSGTLRQRYSIIQPFMREEEE